TSGCLPNFESRCLTEGVIRKETLDSPLFCDSVNRRYRRKQRKDTAVGLRVEGMLGQIKQSPNLFGFLLSHLGFVKLLGILFQRSDRRFFRVVLALLATSSISRAAFSVTLAWDPSPDSNVLGYTLYHGAVGGSVIHTVEIGNQTTATVTNLFGGTTNFFFVAAYDVQLVYSVPSETAVTNIPGIYLPPTISTIADKVIGEDTAT